VRVGIAGGGAQRILPPLTGERSPLGSRGGSQRVPTCIEPGIPDDTLPSSRHQRHDDDTMVLPRIRPCPWTDPIVVHVAAALDGSCDRIAVPGLSLYDHPLTADTLGRVAPWGDSDAIRPKERAWFLS